MIYCSNCGLANRDNSRFCNECGQRLSDWVDCPHCHFSNISTAHFCNRCGGLLDQVATSSAQLRNELSLTLEAEEPPLEVEAPSLPELLAGGPAVPSPVSAGGARNAALEPMESASSAEATSDLVAPPDIIAPPENPPSNGAHTTEHGIGEELLRLPIEPQVAPEPEGPDLTAVPAEAAAPIESVVLSDEARPESIRDAGCAPENAGEIAGATDTAQPAETSDRAMDQPLPQWLVESEVATPDREPSAPLAVPLARVEGQEPVAGIALSRSGTAAFLGSLVVAPGGIEDFSAEGALFQTIAGSAPATATASHGKPASGKGALAKNLRVILLLMLVLAMLGLIAILSTTPLRIALPTLGLLGSP